MVVEAKRPAAELSVPGVHWIVAKIRYFTVSSPGSTRIELCSSLHRPKYWPCSRASKTSTPLPEASYNFVPMAAYHGADHLPSSSHSDLICPTLVVAIDDVGVIGTAPGGDVVTRDDQKPARKLDARPWSGRVLGPTGQLHVLGDLGRLGPRQAVVVALAAPDAARALARSGDDLRLVVRAQGCGSRAARSCPSCGGPTSPTYQSNKWCLRPWPWTRHQESGEIEYD